MAIPLMNLPGYNPGNSLLNFEPIQQALNQKIKQDQMALDNQFRERQFGMQEQEFKATQQAREEDRLAKLKQRTAGIAQMALDDPDPVRGQAMFTRLAQSDPRLAKGYADLGFDITKDWKGAAQATIAEARGYQDPLDRRLKVAQVAKAERDATVDAVDYGKSGAIMQGPDGRFYTVQFGSKGQRQILPIDVGGQNLAPAKGTTVVGDEIVSSATGQTVRNVSPQIAGAEKAKLTGREAGEIENTFPKAQASLRAVSAGQQVVFNTLDQTINRINGYTAGLLGSALAQLPGTEATNVAKDLQTIKANIGFDKLQDMRANSPTGGALGAIAVQELQALQSVFGNIEQAQTPGQLRERLMELRATLQTFQRLREQAFSETYAPVLQARGQTAPRMEFRDIPPGRPIEVLPGVTIEKVQP